MEAGERRAALKAIFGSPGGRWLMERMVEIRDDGIKEFIKLPVAQKTTKAAFNYTAKYEVMDKFIEEIKDEIKQA